MQVNSVGQNINSVRTQKSNAGNSSTQPRCQVGKSVAFTGAPNPIVGLMDFIAAGGYAASFCIQDGLGFIAPRVGKGLLRGGKKKHDKDGNEILDKNGEPKRELNWAYARKEGIREVITGPSAFIIPWIALKQINKHFGSGNSVRLDYIDGFKEPFKSFVQKNKDAVANGNADKKDFYKRVFKDVLNKSINTPEHIELDEAALDSLSEQFAKKQAAIDDINLNNSGWKNKKARKEALSKIEPVKDGQNALSEIGSSVEDDFMALRKKYVGGTANDMAISISASDGKTLKHGSIGELTTAMRNYFDDAVKNVHEAIKKSKDFDLNVVIGRFTKKRMGSRLLTNIGLFGLVALFYTQIPKLYNMGTHGKNPALMNDEEPALASQTNKTSSKDTPAEAKKDVSFGGSVSNLEKLGNKVFTTPKIKSLSDVFELNGPVIQGNAMATLLYGACIPPRLFNAQDKYDFGEILVRDFTAFTALLFGAKALARLFSDGFTKLTGLALNKKDMDGIGFWKKVWGYLNPSDARHSILTSKQLDYKYTNIDQYKGGISGFIDFIENSKGNTKKALAIDANVKAAAEKIVKKATGLSYADATNDQIKDALRKAEKDAPEELEELYDCFRTKGGDLNKLLENPAGKIKEAISKNNEVKNAVEEIVKKAKNKSFAEVTEEDITDALRKIKESSPEEFNKLNNLFGKKKLNKLLNRAKTCNSLFGALSTLILVPGLIISLTDICKKMTEKRQAEEKRIRNSAQAQQAPLIPSSKPTMAGFLNKTTV